MRNSIRRPLAVAAAAATVAAGTALLAPATPATAAPASEVQVSAPLRNAVTLGGLQQHLEALQAIADRNGGNRAAGFPGYDDSAEYVFTTLKAAGYSPVYDEFSFDFFAPTAPASLTVGGTKIATDYFTYSGSGAPTAPVVPVDINLSGTRANTSGCEAADFTGFPAGSIALVQRGTCTFGEKAGFAQAAGAVGVIIFNQGNTAARSGLLTGTLGGADFRIPVVGASFADGAALATATERPVASISASTISEERITRNVLADLPASTGTGSKDRGRGGDVVLVGAHLDSVPAGAGINDNGTGSAGILEIAEQLKTLQTKGAGLKSTVRFAWWGAEELGLLGSEAYVAQLQEEQPEELKRIKLNLNFDMIGSPNFARFIYDGDASAKLEGSAPAPAGSGEIERVFVDYFKAMGLASAPTAFSGRSDYGPFIAEGVDIPAGGLFTGAEGTKTPAQAAAFGGVAGAAYDPCYHQVCDDLRGTGRTEAQQAVYAKLSDLRGNVSLTGFDQMADAAAHAVYTFAVRNLRAGLQDPSGPVGQTDGDLSGGGNESHDDHDHEGETS